MSQTTLQRHISRLMALLLSILLLLPVVPTARADGESGSCGDGLSWNLSAGTLTITGSGAMRDYSETAMAPWHSLREEVLRLELPAGLTKIGSMAFYECSNLITVTIPDSVGVIGDFAFTGCEKMEYMTMGSGVRTIGQYAFSECYMLRALQLPGGLESIGNKAFYRCESIPSVIIPQSVTSLGILAFGYCKSLVSADIRANIKSIPEFLFYECNLLTSVSLPSSINSMGSYVFEGCDQLSTIYYEGDSYSTEQIKETVNDTVPEFETSGTVTDSKPTGVTNVETTKTDSTGNTVQESITVSQGENTTISSKIESTEDSANADFSVTITEEEDWDNAQMYIDSILNDTDVMDDININIYIQDESQLDADFVDKMTDKGATITVITQNGSTWTIDGKAQKKEEKTASYDLRYTLLRGSEELNAELGTDNSFIIQFASDAEVNAEVKVLLGAAWAGNSATLFQHDEDGVTVIQTVIVDNDGYAHFFLAKVSKDIRYSIGMNIASEQSNAIVPKEILPAYGNLENYQPIQYVITGRSSSWNMGLGKVMAILAVVMVSAIGVIGFVMYFWNKQRLKAGYVPQWDDEDETT